MYEWENLISQDRSNWNWEEGRIIYGLEYKEFPLPEGKTSYSYTSPFEVLRDEFGFTDREFDRLVEIVGANENYTTRRFYFDSVEKRDATIVMVGHLLYNLTQSKTA